MRAVNFIPAVVLILAVTVIFANANEYGGEGPGEMHGAARDTAALPHLNLTEGQKAQITSLHETLEKDTAPLRDKLSIKRGELKSLWLDMNPAQEKILATQAQIRSLRGQIQDRTSIYRLAVRRVLTAEQVTKLDQIVHQRGAGTRGSLHYYRYGRRSQQVIP